MLKGSKLNGRYEIIEHIGEGATSAVYKGRDTLLGRIVALKILHTHVRENTRERFFQEAMAAAQLNHPNIMAIYDRGDDRDRSYLVVEHVDGNSLGDFIPCAPDILVGLGAQIARALDYAHEREIIHRDIKPANIMVTGEGRIKIMDLGLALPREAKRVTAPGMVIGTPAYISPEQAKGKELDRRTDLYSLGVVLYEMATGELPFNADDITALLLQHVQQPPPPPRLLKPDLPQALENVILKSLEKNREKRFQNGSILADNLQAAVPNAPTYSVDYSAPAPDRDATLPNRPPGLPDDIATTRASDQVKKSSTILRVVLADDHKLLRTTLANYLDTHDNIMVVAQAGDGNEALTAVLDNNPDILLLDLNMPNRTGLEVLPDIREQAPNVKVLVLTGRDDELYIMRALRSGAHGYVLKSTDEHILLDSIRRVMNNEMVLGSGVAEKVVTGMIQPRDDKKLTEQEMDVLLHVAVGLPNEKIAERLGISMTQVIETNAKIMNKMGVKDRGAAALKALRTGLILVEDLHELQAKL